MDPIPAWAIDELIALTKKAYSISALWMLRTCVMALWFIHSVRDMPSERSQRKFVRAKSSLTCLSIFPVKLDTQLDAPTVLF